MSKKLYIIDGHALCYRAYYAFIKNPLKNSSGQNTSAIFGFVRMLFKLIEEQKPDYLAVAFDPPKKSFRFELYSEYKANRQKMPDDLKSQIEEIKNMVQVLGIKMLVEPDYEADDILGTVSANYASENLEVVLVTGDKDAYQLVNENVKIYANKKGISEHEIYDSEAVENKLGIRPDQVIDYMAITGDTSDNVPGVKGIGEKGALKLINEYSSLDSIYENIENIKGKTKELLIKEKEMAYLSKDLVSIRKDVAIELDVDKLNVPSFNTPEIREYFKKLEMNSIVRDFFGEETKTAGVKQKAEVKKYEIIRDEESLLKAIAEIKKAGIVSVDTETTSLQPVESELVGISLSIKEKTGWYIPLLSTSLFPENMIPLKQALAILKDILEDPSIKKIGQNIKYDLSVFKNQGIKLAGVYFDTMIASYLINPNERRHNLDDMAENYLNYKTITYTELTGKGKNAVSISEVPVEKTAEYAIEDADIALRLYIIFEKKISENELSDLFFNIEMPLVEILSEMESCGVKVDTEYFKELALENNKLLADVEKNIFKESGSEFNINSTQELAVVLFDKLGMKPVKKTKTGFSTDITVLEALQGKHPVIKHLISYRTLSKLKNTYIDALPQIIIPKTGRIHTSYNQTVAATGRLSSSDPNLQNIPIRDDFGKKIRRGFIPDKGFMFLSADYSQIELRLAAHLSGDENMIRAFRDGIDIHSMTASSVFGVPIIEVNSDMRRQAKIINFATIYGVSPYGLSQQADIGFKEAVDFIRIYFETYPGFRKYIDETIDFAKKNGYVKTMLGRKRPVPEINSKTVFMREGAERIAINTPIQGTSADMIKIAMIKIFNELNSLNMKSRMIMQVHDELVIEVFESEKEKVEKIVKSNMENAVRLNVPVIVDTGWGKNWEEAH